MYFLVNASPHKLLVVATSNYNSAFGQIGLSQVSLCQVSLVISAWFEGMFGPILFILLITQRV